MNSRQPKLLLGLTGREQRLIALMLALNAMASIAAPPALRVPAGLGAALATSRLAARAGVGAEAQGLLLKDAPGGIACGLLAALPVSAAIACGATHRRTAPYYLDPHLTGHPAYEAGIRIPLGTALPEELVFRGAVLGLLCRRNPDWLAAAASAGLFGLWHVLAGLRRAARRHPDEAVHPLLHLAVSVVFTSVAGYAMAVLRLRSRSIVAPWLLHAAANSMGYIAARLAVQKHQGRLIAEAPL